METAIEIIWWIGLIGALIPTLIILKEVAVLLKALRDIHELALLTREAARGIAGNVDAESELASLIKPIEAMNKATRQLTATAAGIEARLRTLAGGHGQE